MANVYVMEGANLICGSGGDETAPGWSTHLVLSELKLPGFEENYVDHTPAGAPVGIEVPTHVNKLEATFNLAGWDPMIMAFMGQNDPFFHTFTAYGLIRDRMTSKALQAIAVMQGRIGRVNPAAFSRGNLMHHEYSIKSIVSYTLTMELAKGAFYEVFNWDFFTSDYTVGNVDLNNDLNRLLAIA